MKRKFCSDCHEDMRLHQRVVPIEVKEYKPMLRGDWESLGLVYEPDGDPWYECPDCGAKEKCDDRS
jgi:hypothetical protein